MRQGILALELIIFVGICVIRGGNRGIGLTNYKYRKWVDVSSVTYFVVRVRFRNDSMSRFGICVYKGKDRWFEVKLGPDFVELVNGNTTNITYINTTLDSGEITPLWIQWYDHGTTVGHGEKVGVDILSSGIVNGSAENVTSIAFNGLKTELQISTSVGYRCYSGFKMIPMDEVKFTPTLLNCVSFCQSKNFAMGLSYVKSTSSCKCHIVFDGGDGFPLTKEIDPLSKSCFQYNI
ncbi:hypothetical protein LOTGIDRAFT_174086 [Lottia gigantea]|uniref:Uncharacterized protein n=1 Tax=Lottia gigantea TaxID=225164 RepID=V4CA00_LOTGI|nr:hypothetical protein LOTGIDRAFT_174086 [Lottia gigantea]ESO98614.1 hypothetical protein LOTGIDRAFT_174086 [Lottia gigantea]